MRARRLRPLVMLTALTALALPIGAQQTREATPAAPPKPQVGTASISGTIVGDGPGARPVRRVTVALSPASSTVPGLGRVTTTDDAGRFGFRDLPAGTYSSLRATKQGFVPIVYGEKRVGGIGTPIALAEGQTLTVAFKMLRGAVVTGTLLDERGMPMPQVTVQASPIRVVEGVRTAGTVMAANSATTDDRGVFRIFGLPPGDYIVSATPRSVAGLYPITAEELQWADRQLQPATSGSAGFVSSAPPRPAQAIAYTPVYYSGSTDPNTATLVTLAAGEERSGVDFKVQYVATAKIEGTLLDPEGLAPQNVQLNIVSRSSSQLIVDPFFMLDSMLLMSRTVTPDGRFIIPGVRPGEYTITARAARGLPPGAPPPPPGPPSRGGPASAPTLWATADITVDGVDQSGLALRLRPGLTITGRVMFNGTTLKPPADLSRVSIRLGAAPNPSGVTVSVNPASAQVAADGTFKLEGVTPGRYFISASSPTDPPVPGSAWMMKSATMGGADAADLPFEVRPDEEISDALVTFIDTPSEISGTLLDAAGKPTPEFSIILFSTDRRMWSQRGRRSRPPVRAGTDGKFRFANLLPGEYYIAALTDFEPNDYFNPTFLDQVAAAGAIKITVGEGEKKVQDLKISGG